MVEATTTLFLSFKGSTTINNQRIHSIEMQALSKKLFLLYSPGSFSIKEGHLYAQATSHSALHQVALLRRTSVLVTFIIRLSPISNTVDFENISNSLRKIEVKALIPTDLTKQYVIKITNNNDSAQQAEINAIQRNIFITVKEITRKKI